MPDLLQFKRGASGNLKSVQLKQGEPAYCYDTKLFVIGTGDNQPPTTFINAQDLDGLLKTIQADYNHQISAEVIRTNILEVAKREHENRISLLEIKSQEKIKSSQLSTAYDADKIQLANLSQAVMAAINNGGGAGGGGMTEIAPGSIGFDLLAAEVNEWLDSDYGSY